MRGDDTHLAAALPGWHLVGDEALQKGRAGVAVASRTPAVAVRKRFGDDALDDTGRWVETDFDIAGERLTVVSAYVHSGEDGTPKQIAKYAFLDAMTARLPELARDGALALVTGDLNVGHRELDIRNWRGNVKNAGFLPRERALLRPLPRPRGEQVTGSTARSAWGWGGSTSVAAWRARSTDPTHGGRIAARPSTTTRGGASTITSRRPRSPSA